MPSIKTCLSLSQKPPTLIIHVYLIVILITIIIIQRRVVNRNSST